MAPPDHPLVAARRLGRPQFVAQFLEPLLVGDSVRELDGDTPQPTPEVSWNKTAVATKFGAHQLATLVCALRKVHKNFPSMITVGRTPNSDIVIPDDSVSKMHGFFKRLGSDATFGLTDSGSTNGTFIDDVKVVAHGAPIPIQAGMRVRFGRIVLIVMSAGSFWDSVH